MRRLLNTLFILTETTYLSLENENIIISKDDSILKRFPLRMFEQILYFGYKGASPALMGACAKQGISLCFYKPTGRFLARVSGNNYGNVLLRKEQYRISDDLARSCLIARDFIVGKIYNSRSVLKRACRDHGLSLNTEQIHHIGEDMLVMARKARSCNNLDTLRGLEGEAASLYFSQFDQLILQKKSFFSFTGRMKRPPKDPVNAMLSFAYTLLANDCAAALEGVGLDPYVGFLHRDRPGRASLALDLMEELRSIFADRFVLTLINNRMVNEKSFIQQENGSIMLVEEARKIFLNEWQERKKVIVTHPFLNEKVPWGLVPFIQALLLARYIRGDLEQYPCLLWK